MSTGSVETEIKLPVRDLAAVEEKLKNAGFTRKTARTFEANTIYDTAGNELRGSGRLLRLRIYGDTFTLTYKGAGSGVRHKSREELETTVESAEAMGKILERLGYRIIFRYEKYRSEFSDGRGVAVVDETPIGNYLELEGEGEWIDERAKELGYGETDYITDSYGSLYTKYRGEHTGTTADMVFGKQP